MSSALMEEIDRALSEGAFPYIPESKHLVPPADLEEALVEVYAGSPDPHDGMSKKDMDADDFHKHGKVTKGMLFQPPESIRDAPFPIGFWWEAVRKTFEKGQQWAKGKAPGEVGPDEMPQPAYWKVYSKWKDIVQDATGLPRPGGKGKGLEQDKTMTQELQDLKKRAAQLLRYAKTHKDKDVSRMAARLLGYSSKRSREREEFQKKFGQELVDESAPLEEASNLQKTVEQAIRKEVRSYAGRKFFTIDWFDGAATANIPVGADSAAIVNTLEREFLGKGVTFKAEQIAPDMSILTVAGAKGESSGLANTQQDSYDDVVGKPTRNGRPVHESNAQKGVSMLLEDKIANILGESDHEEEEGHEEEEEEEELDESTRRLNTLAEQNNELRNELRRQRFESVLKEYGSQVPKAYQRDFIESLDPASQFEGVEDFRQHVSESFQTYMGTGTNPSGNPERDPLGVLGEGLNMFDRMMNISG